VRFEDLPPSVQRQISKGRAVNTIAGRDPYSVRPQRGVSAPQPPKPRARESWKCHDCGETFTQWAPAQRHANENRHVRIELVLPGEQ
jgi:hypothetical protein